MSNGCWECICARAMYTYNSKKLYSCKVDEYINNVRGKRMKWYVLPIYRRFSSTQLKHHIELWRICWKFLSIFLCFMQNAFMINSPIHICMFQIKWDSLDDHKECVFLSSCIEWMSQFPAYSRDFLFFERIKLCRKTEFLSRCKWRER